MGKALDFLAGLGPSAMMVFGLFIIVSRLDIPDPVFQGIVIVWLGVIAQRQG